MEAVALLFAIIALVIALQARAKSASLSRRVEDAASDAGRRAESFAEELEAEAGNLRRLIGELAAGAKLSPEMIMTGRLWQNVSPAQGAEMVSRGDLRIIDVRTPQETAGGIIPGAVLIPIDQLEQRFGEIPDDGKTTLIYCAGGGRSAAACERLSEKGYRSLFNLEGGFTSWRGPVARP